MDNPPFQDAFSVENGDVLMSSWFSGVYSIRFVTALEPALQNSGAFLYWLLFSNMFLLANTCANFGPYFSGIEFRWCMEAGIGLLQTLNLERWMKNS